MTQKLGDLVHFDVDGGKPARNPATLFGFELLDVFGRPLPEPLPAAEIEDDDDDDDE